MGEEERYYHQLHSILEHYRCELKQKNTEHERLNAVYIKECAELDRSLKEDLKENEEKIIRLHTYISLAKSHTQKLLESKAEIPYDETKLSVITVQFNNMDSNTPHAAQLFTEATGQMKYVMQEEKRIKERIDRKKRELTEGLEYKLAQLNKEKEKTIQEIKAQLSSNAFKNFIGSLQNDIDTYMHGIGQASEYITIGTVKMPLSLPKKVRVRMEQITQGIYNAKSGTIGIPMQVSVETEQIILIDYENQSEKEMLMGISNYLLNIVRYFEHKYVSIVFIDPVRLNSSALGCMSSLMEVENLFIKKIPHSSEEIKKEIENVVFQINNEEKSIGIEEKKYRKRLFIFHDFPNGYDTNSIAQIQQLCANFEHYGITIILTHNCSVRNTAYTDIISFISSMAMNIHYLQNEFVIKKENQGNEMPFKWYCVPSVLPDEIKKKMEVKRTVHTTGNDYENKIGIAIFPKYKKGMRDLSNIPYGVDQNGNILSLDFENSNFATFICGAARSGKSTLLHTIITGIIKRSHPDDVEIWLVDFKMTEFSRYVTHLPPHVRYIILDESPELVFDIIDRLTEILTKRQNMFKGKWQKLSDVPLEKYMPEIFVIIDEFSIMSQIIAESVNMGRDNYSVKLQALLAKGAAFGLRFIFASQGFTTGTRGLNDFSKKQIQQRIAMKTEFNEIKETLDLRSATDEDRTMMEQLSVHYALLRIPADSRGNHLSLSKVLYISDYALQENLIMLLQKNMHSAKEYQVNEIQEYIDKRAIIVDGNSYTSFALQSENRENYLRKFKRDFSNDGEMCLFIGEPRRMIPIFALKISKNFHQNILLLAPHGEKIPAVSIIASIIESMSMQEMKIELWSTRNNDIYKQMKRYQNKFRNVARELEGVCDEIRKIRKKIDMRLEENHFFILLGFETLLMDMVYQQKSLLKENEDIKNNHIIEKRLEGEPDLLSFLGRFSQDDTAPREIPQQFVSQNGMEKTQLVYDAREDLKYILTHGPRLGYHFMMVYSTVAELNQSRFSMDLFQHKIFFRIPRTEAAGVIGSIEAGIISELEEHSFRYSNGLETLSFRPYLHPGLSWDGWKLDGEKVVCISEEDEYLL